MLEASGKRGVPQGGVVSPLLANIYLNEVDGMLERAKAVTRRGLAHPPLEGFVDGLQSIGFPLPCHPSYGAAGSCPGGTAPAEHVSVTLDTRELQKLGMEISQATVSKCLVRHRKPPSQTWRTFLDNHIQTLVSVDFFVVPTVMFKVLFVFVVLAHDRRRIVHFNVTGAPTALEVDAGHVVEQQVVVERGELAQSTDQMLLECRLVREQAIEGAVDAIVVDQRRRQGEQVLGQPLGQDLVQPQGAPQRPAQPDVAEGAAALEADSVQPDGILGNNTYNIQ